MTLDTIASRREAGEAWERNFCILAASYGKEFTPHQLVRREGAAISWWLDAGGVWRKQLLPDVVIWSKPGEHHEIKHKDLMSNGCYGYELYRLRELVRFANVTGQKVYLTIHDWRHAGATSRGDATPNRIEDWFYSDIEELSQHHTGSYKGSIVAGKWHPDVPGHTWRRDEFFHPLAELWAG